MKKIFQKLFGKNYTKTLPPEGAKIKIIHLPPCINGSGETNPYIGMSGTVYHDIDAFSIFTGSSWLVGLTMKKCKFVFIH